MRKLNDTEIFVDEVETQLREKPNTNASQPGLLPEGVFNGILYLRADP